LGRFAGNSLEVKECVDILSGQMDLAYYSETRELSLHLAAHMLALGEKAKSAEEGYAKAKSILQSGQAYEKFLSLCQYQGPASPADLPFCETHTDVVAPQDGWIISMNTEQIGLAAIELGAGRKVATD